MEVEHVTGEGLAARRAAQQQRHLTVGLGLLGEVVVDDERVLAVLHPVLAHGATAVGSQVLERCRVGSRGDHDGGVLHSPELFERGNRLGDGRGLLADRHIDALHAQTLLVQDRVERNGGLAGLAVADDQLSLATADRDEGVDRLDTGLHRLVHRLAAGDARCLDLHTAGLHIGERTLAVDRLAERVDDTAQQAVADGHGQDVAGGDHGLAFLDAFDVAEDHGADRILVEVEGETDETVLEAEHLVDRRVGQARHARNAVADLEHPTDGGLLDRGGEALEVRLQRCGDLIGVDLQISHFRLSLWCEVLGGAVSR